LSITSKNIRLLLDSDRTDDEKINKIASWAIDYPANFLAGINAKSLGKKRVRQLENLALIMADSNDEDERAVGEYLNRTLAQSKEAQKQAKLEAWKLANLHIDRADRAMRAGNLKKSDEEFGLAVRYLSEA